MKKMKLLLSVCVSLVGPAAFADIPPPPANAVITGDAANQLASFIGRSPQTQGFDASGDQNGEYLSGEVNVKCVKKSSDSANTCTITAVSRSPASSAKKKN